ncbi:ARID DNA-binding domain-containing protein [Tanacetum coccineum]|uniref:ARID DNA-binding domain-containing protein n=1 Tax=Tanacetum coccineum TaxID=301880 RepID=A0ABQ5HNS6_9ASTR
MMNYKRLLETNWFRQEPVQQWHQSRRSKSWEKPIQNQMQRDGKWRYSLNKRTADSLPKYSQRKRISFECKEMLKKRLKEIEAFNASNVRAAIKEKKDGKAIARKNKRARCYICKKRGHVFWKCPNKKNSTTPRTPIVENKTREPIVVEDEEVFKYPEDVHVKTNYMVEGTNFSNWNNIWYVSNAYKKHMCPTKSLFKRLKNRFRMEGTEESEKKFIFSHGIEEAVVETNENEIVIPCVLYTPEVTLNMLYDGERDYGKGKGCDIKTESMIAKQNKYLEEYFDSIDPKYACPLIKGLEELKWDRNMVQDYLDDDYISVNGTLYAIKVNSFQRFISFLDLMKDDKLVYKNWSVLSKRFEDMLKWFYLIYLGRDVLETLPPIIGRVKIDLLGLYKMVDSMGGYLGVSFGNKWKDIALIHGLTKEHDEELKECYKRTIDLVKCYYKTTLRARYKEGLVRYEETEKVERNPQEGVGSSGLQVVKDNTHERFKNIQGRETHFGVTLKSDNKTDGNQVTDQRDERNTSENDDFVVVT